ncbi:hypothetical protein CLSAB_19130 [Clostridium saccharobutylicum]|uniref:hypothetical protein n=1 Tax=Clostridium saccharobutylicum TaxID=169679 RepID=UPI00098CE94E|nr:hypothetical protein [Clostridium saccharobutylicum]OOM17193.1 hypothetical protein CLSAB_19130 [Clostridium saccharobutylicum]
MYKIKYCHTDLQLEEFIDKVNENNYEIILITNFKDKLTIIYKIEEKKKSRKSKQVGLNIEPAIGESNKDIKKLEKEILKKEFNKKITKKEGE